MNYSFNVVLTAVSLTAAAVAAYFALREADNIAFKKLETRVSAMERALESKVDVDKMDMLENQLAMKLSMNDLMKEEISETIADALALPSRFREASNVVPAGAVVAFDLSRGCPEGWSEFLQAQSRSIIGAAFANKELDPTLTRYVFDDTGVRKPSSSLRISWRAMGMSIGICTLLKTKDG